jgi:hypothetical protein
MACHQDTYIGHSVRSTFVTTEARCAERSFPADYPCAGGNCESN